MYTDVKQYNKDSIDEFLMIKPKKVGLGVSGETGKGLAVISSLQDIDEWQFLTAARKC